MKMPCVMAAAAALLLLACCPGGSLAQTTYAGRYQRLPFETANVAVAMVQIGGTDKFVLLSRIARAGKLVGIVDLAENQAVAFPSPDNHFCAGVGVLPDGGAVLYGGSAQNKAGADGRYSIGVVGMDQMDSPKAVRRAALMDFPRWYPTICRIDDIQHLIVGGTALQGKGATPKVAELWDGESEETEVVDLPDRFDKVKGFNWYPWMQLLPNGNILWWASRSGSITSNKAQGFKELDTLPWLNVTGMDTMYPFTSTFSPLALDPKNGYAPAFVLFGGGASVRRANAPAPSTSQRLNLTPCRTSKTGYCFATPNAWEQEDMGLRMLMGMSTLLPNGKIIVQGGAGAGFANLINKATGENMAQYPNMQGLMYDPYAPKGKRFTPLRRATIMRLYHSSACLTRTGEVLVSGCETCSQNVIGLPTGVSLSPDAPDDYRMELIIPSDIDGVVRPAILDSPQEVQRGSTFTVTYRYPLGGRVTGASLAAPCADTHSINMNQRVVFLEVDKVSTTTVTLKAPPADMPYVAPAGWYVLYLLGEDGVYSEGVWVQITAPPASALSGSGSGSNGGSGGNSGGAGKGKGKGKGNGPKKAAGRAADNSNRKAK